MTQDVTASFTPAQSNYLHIVCHDTVWVFAIFRILNERFGYAQVINPSDAYMTPGPNNTLQFYLNRETCPMAKVAAMCGASEEDLAKARTITLRELPFDKELPRPTQYWGNA